jgi:hypothetical protein
MMAADSAYPKRSIEAFDSIAIKQGFIRAASSLQSYPLDVLIEQTGWRIFGTSAALSKAVFPVG